MGSGTRDTRSAAALLCTPFLLLPISFPCPWVSVAGVYLVLCCSPAGVHICAPPLVFEPTLLPSTLAVTVTGVCHGLAGVYLAVSSENKVWAAHNQGQADYRKSQGHHGRHQHWGGGEEVSFTTFLVFLSVEIHLIRSHSKVALNGFQNVNAFRDVTDAKIDCFWLTCCLGGLRLGYRVAALEDREYQMDRLEFVKNQLNLLIADVKVKIKAISEDVASKVTDEVTLQPSVRVTATWI